MHPRNKLRLLAGVQMDPELEREHSIKLKKEAFAEAAREEQPIDDPTDTVEQVVSPNVPTDGAIDAVKNVIKHLEGQIHKYSDNPSVVKTDKRDLAAYDRILSLLFKENNAGAKRVYQDLDTAARELIADPQIVTKKGNRKASSSLLEFELLAEDMEEAIEEGIGMEMLFGQNGIHVINRFLNKMVKHVDIEKGALALYHKLVNMDGRDSGDALHAAGSTFGMSDKEFSTVLRKAVPVREGEEENDEVISEDHFEVGSHVVDKFGKVWKITSEGSDGEESDDELYKLKDISSGETSEDIAGNLRKVTKEEVESVIDESVHDYKDTYKDFEDDEEKPVNVSDGSSNDEQVYDGMERKPESPHQLREPGELSAQDNSDYDIDLKMKVPSNIISALKKEADKARDEAQKLDIRDKNSSYFYRDLGRAFDDLRGHLEKGTVYDVKQAQIFAQTLMGPMLHKIPNEVWKWLTNAGKTRSLKDYMKEVGNEDKLKKGYDPTKEKAA